VGDGERHEERAAARLIRDVSARGGGAHVEAMLVSAQLIWTLLLLIACTAALAQMRRWW
jgi:hypothetical protein